MTYDQELSARKPPLSPVGPAGYYMVGFFDLLGQSAKLMELDKLPSPSTSTQQRIELQVKECTETIARFRAEFVNSVKNDKFNTERIYYPDEMSVWGLADSFCVALPISPPMAGYLMRVCQVFWTTSRIWLAALAEDRPLRGGIDVGIATPVPFAKEEVYGPAVAKAYHLESKVADWPRIVIGDRCVDMLRGVMKSGDGFTEKDPPKEPEMQISRMAKSAAAMIQLDEGRQPFLNVIGPMVMAVLVSAMPETRRLFDKAHNNVRMLCDRWRSHPKLEKRYKKLLTYFDDQAAGWRSYQPTCKFPRLS